MIRGQRFHGLNAAVLWTLISFQTAGAEFEEWTRNDGRSAELELARVRVERGEEVCEFRTRGGEAWEMKLDELAEPDQQRAKEWTSERIETSFIKMDSDSVEGKVRTSFWWDVKSDGLIGLVFERNENGVIRPGKPEVVSKRHRGRPIVFDYCTGWLERDAFDGVYDPFAGKGVIDRGVPKREGDGEHRKDGPGVLIVTLVGADPEQFEGAEPFRAKVLCEFGEAPKEVRGKVRCSKSEQDLEFQKVGSYRVALKPLYESDKNGNKLVGEGPSCYTLELHDSVDEDEIIGSYVVVEDGLDSTWTHGTAKASYEVVIRYWSKIVTVPVIVRQ